ncbi:hypothetical protein ACHAWF_008609 [Thalassiosira exigua]
MEVEYTGWRISVRDRSDIVRARMAPYVAEIGDRAFSNCTELRELDLGTVAKIGASAFRNCDSLSRIDFPPRKREIGDQAFYECIGLVRVELCEGLQLIGEEAFGGSWKLEHVQFPSTVTEIGARAFADCEALRELVFPEGDRKIGARAFLNCRSLETITFRSNITDIGQRAFDCCTSLREVQMCEGIHHIGSASFRSCAYLHSISVPPNAFLVEWGDAPSCRLLSNSIIPPGNRFGERTVVSGKLGGMSLNLIAEIEERINQIIRHQDRTLEKKLELLRDMIAPFRMQDATKIESGAGNSKSWRRGT